MHLFQSQDCRDGVNFAIVLPKLALVKPIEHNERDVEGETSMGVDVLQNSATGPPNGVRYWQVGGTQTGLENGILLRC